MLVKPNSAQPVRVEARGVRAKEMVVEEREMLVVGVETDVGVDIREEIPLRCRVSLVKLSVVDVLILKAAF